MCRHGHFNMVHFLLSAGSDPNAIDTVRLLLTVSNLLSLLLMHCRL